MKLIIWLSLVIFLVSFSCSIPEDPNNSWLEAQKSGLKVGVIYNPPFSNYNSDSISGSEVQLLQQFCHANNIDINYTVGNESSLVKKVEESHLHVLIGGFQEKTIWKKKTGLTFAYDSSHVFLVPKGENRLVWELEKFFLNKKASR